MKHLIHIFLLSILFTGCASQRISMTRDVIYDNKNQLALDIFSPKKNANTPKEVLVFIHGGNWNRGSKSIYGFFGKRMAKRNIVAVIIDYRLNPFADYEGMAMDAATALKWTKNNISSYGGDPNKIFISGHSAGGQIAALVATDDEYFEKLGVHNPVKGTIMIDGFGLDMYSYLKRGLKYNKDVFETVFTKDPETWKKASPVYHLNNETPPFLMLVGGKTFENIIIDNNIFYDSIKKYRPETQLYRVKHTGHLGMIFKYTNPQKEAYKEMMNFMKGSNELVHSKK